MIRRILSAFAVEFFKSSRLFLPYLGISLAMLAVLVTLAVPGLSGASKGFAFVADAVSAGLNISFLLLLAYGAGLVAGEVETGTIRTVLIQPIRRHEFLAAKMLNAFSYALLLNTVTVLVAWSLPALRRELIGIDYGGELLYTAGEMNAALAVAAALNLAPHLTGAAYAVMISTLARRSGTAIGLSVGLWLLVDYAKHRLQFARFVFTSYLEDSWVVFGNRARGLATPYFPDAALGLAVCALWFILFTAVAFAAIRRRNFGP